MIAEVSPQLAWYVARSSGLVAWVLAASAVLWGLALSTRLVRARGIPAWLADLHAFLGTLTLVFVGVHLVGLWADSYVQFGLRELFVPRASPWKPGPVAWGIVAMYLLVAVQLTSWVKRWLPRRLWRVVHLSPIPMLAMSTVHGIQSGTDRSNLVVQWVTMVAIALVLFLGVFRLAGPRRARRRAPSSVTAA